MAQQILIMCVCVWDREIHIKVLDHTWPLTSVTTWPDLNQSAIDSCVKLQFNMLGICHMTKTIWMEKNVARVIRLAQMFRSMMSKKEHMVQWTPQFSHWRNSPACPAQLSAHILITIHVCCGPATALTQLAGRMARAPDTGIRGFMTQNNRTHLSGFFQLQQEH